MGAGIVLQGLTTVRGGAGSSLVQPMDQAADMRPFRDVVLFLDVADFSNATFQLQTSPVMDENHFKDFGSSVVPASATVSTVVIKYSAATVPLCRYVRWKISGASAWSLTFRAFLAGNYCGCARRQMPDFKRSLDEYLKRYDDDARRAASGARLPRPAPPVVAAPPATATIVPGFGNG